MALSLGELVAYLKADDSKLNKTLDAADRRMKASAKLALMAGAIQPALQLGAALAPVAGAVAALPAAAAAAKVAMTTLSLALSGVGDALSEAVAGDMEKFEEQLEKMPSNARKVVGQLGGAFKGLRKTVQQAFFGPLAKDAEGLGKTLRGPLQNSFKDVGKSLGGLGAEVMSFARSGSTLKAFKSLFKEVADGIDAAKFGVKPLLMGVRDLIGVFVPGFGSAGQAVGNAMTMFGRWLSKVSKGGQAFSWATGAKDTLGKLWDIAKNVGSALSAMFSASGVSGEGLLDNIQKITEKFQAWAESAGGQQQTAQTFALLAQVTSDLAVILPGVVGVIAQIASWIGGLPPGVQSVVSGFLAWSIVGGLLIGKLSGVFSAIGTTIGGIGKLVTAVKTPESGLRNFFSKIGSGFSSMGSAIRTGAGRVASFTTTMAGDFKRGAGVVGEWGRNVGSRIGTAAKNAGSAMANMGRSAGTAAANFGRSMMTMGASAGRAAIKVIAASGQMLASMARVALQTTIAAAKVVAGWILMGIQSMINAIKMAVAWVISMGPVAIIIAIVIALVGLIIAYWDEIWAATQAIFTAIWNFIQGAFDFVLGIINWFIDWVKENWPLLLAIITGPFGLAIYFIIKFKDDIIAAIQFAIQWVIDGFGELVGFVTSLPGKIASAASGMFNGIRDAFKSALNALIGMWNDLSLTIPEIEVLGVKVGGFTLSTPDLPMLANGGTAIKRGAALVGEKGPEIIDMPEGARVRPLDRADDQGASRQPIKTGPTYIFEKVEVRGHSDHFHVPEVVRKLEAYAEMQAP